MHVPSAHMRAQLTPVLYRLSFVVVVSGQWCTHCDCDARQRRTQPAAPDATCSAVVWLASLSRLCRIKIVYNLNNLHKLAHAEW